MHNSLALRSTHWSSSYDTRYPQDTLPIQTTRNMAKMSFQSCPAAALTTAT